jgi:hypothetical protein
MPSTKFLPPTIEPVNGAKEEGALGAVKGFAKGTAGLATKVPSGKQFAFTMALRLCVRNAASILLLIP